MIRDIRALNDSAEKISTGDTNVLVTVVRNDEIGELASSFSRMVSSLKIMMMDEEP
jgi:adenylate cyclase